MNKNENIMAMYNQITLHGLKGRIHTAVANACGVKTNSVKQNWFKPKDFPEKHQDRVIKIMQNAVKMQNNFINSLEVEL